jgi:hypothetical protein
MEVELESCPAPGLLSNSTFYQFLQPAGITGLIEETNTEPILMNSNIV